MWLFVIQNNFQELSVKEKDFKGLEAFINSIKHNYPKLNINISGYDASYMYDALFRKQHFVIELYVQEMFAM